MKNETNTAAPATPAPLAGDAVESIAVALWHRFAPEDRMEWDEEFEQAIYRDAAEQVLALAQDRASQGAAAGVPDALGWLRLKLLSEPVRREKMGGQTHSYFAADEVIGWVEEAQKRAASTPSAPTQGAEREVE